MNLLQNEAVENRQFPQQQQQQPHPYHQQINSNNGGTPTTVLQQHSSASAAGGGGFNCRQCGKAEYRNGEFATIKLGDIFTHIDHFPSATSSETLCASCACVNDAAANVAAAGSRIQNQNPTGVIGINHNRNYNHHGSGGNGVININNNDSGLKPMTNGTSTIVSTMDYHSNNAHQLQLQQQQQRSLQPQSASSAGIGSSTTVLHRTIDAYRSPGRVIKEEHLSMSPQGYSASTDNNNTEAIDHVTESRNHVYLTVLSSSNEASIETNKVANVAIPNISQNQNHSQKQQGQSGQSIIMEGNGPTPTYKILGSVVSQNSTNVTLRNNPDVRQEEEVKAKATAAKLKVAAGDEPPRVPCTLCKKTFKNQTMASIHLKRVHEKVNRFVCEICGVGFSYRGSLDSHLASHNPPAITHDCPTCGQKFKEKSNLNKHIRYHTENPKKFLCEHCPSGFSKRVNLRYHIKRKHPEVAMNNNNVLPTAPANVLMVPGYFPPTLGSKTGGGVYPVDENSTNMTPPNSTTLTTLVSSGRAAVGTGGQDIPLSTSTASKANGKDKTQGNFKCDQCGRGFLFKNNLKAHLRTHTRDKKYTCDLCQKSFIYKESLKNHMLLHSNELPYLCDICGKKFRDRSNRRKHVKNVHKYMFVNGDINNPIPTASASEPGPPPPAPGLAVSIVEPKTKKRGGKKSTAQAQGDGPPNPKARNIIKSPSKKSKSTATNSNSVGNANNAKSVIVSMSSSSLIEGSCGSGPIGGGDRKIIMSPNPNKNPKSPPESSMEYTRHPHHHLPVTLHIPLAGPSGPINIGGGQFSHRGGSESSISNRNIIVKAASSTILSNQSSHSMSPSDMYVPIVGVVDERGASMQQNVIVYPKSKILDGGGGQHHQYSPSSVISQNIHQSQHHQSQQYYARSNREDQEESEDRNVGYDRSYLSHGHGPSSVEALQQQQQPSRSFEYILSSSPPMSSNPSSNEDIKMFGSPPEASGEIPVLGVMGQYSNVYTSEAYPHPHGNTQPQQQQQHYWITNVGQSHPGNASSPYSSAGTGSNPSPEARGGPSGQFSNRHPNSITSASNVLNAPAYGQPHAGEPVDPGVNNVSNFLYKDLSQFDFSYL